MDGQDKILFSSGQVTEMVQILARALIERYPGLDRVALVGIRRGGDYLVHRLCGELELFYGAIPVVGAIDITLYRDDWKLDNPAYLYTWSKVGRTSINFSLDNMVVVLVDDVLYTGRTVRAALDEVIDFGRPQRIELAALIDRGWRELPIQADYVGATLVALPEEIIEVELIEAGAGRDQVVSRWRNF